MMNLDNRIKRLVKIVKLLTLFTLGMAVSFVLMPSKPVAIILVVLLSIALFLCDRALQLKALNG